METEWKQTHTLHSSLDIGSNNEMGVDDARGGISIKHSLHNLVIQTETAIVY